MGKFEQSILIPVHESQRTLTFSSHRDARTWVDKEAKGWSEFDATSISDPHLRNYWQEQLNFLRHVSSALQAIEQANTDISDQERANLHVNLINALAPVTQGLRMCRDSRWFPHIVDLWKASPDAAALVLIAARSDASSLMGNFGQGMPFVALVKAILRTGKAKGTDDWLQPQRDEIATLKSELELTRDQLRLQADEIGGIAAAHSKTELGAVTARNTAWTAELDKVQGDWERLRKTYDEAMAMAAPSQYWQGRAGSHKNQAIAFGFVFAAILGVGLFFFFADGLSYLANHAGKEGSSVILTLVPVAVPAFALIWVMRILGRMLGESLHMMRDAKERETMVKTFLAFVHDEERGKSLLLEQDRILILHALFRPSSVTSVDDSPPIHWFDILTNKMADKGSKP